MQTVRQLLGMKQVEVFSVAADAAVIEAIRLMADKSIGAVLVMEGERLVGIVSERDYARKVVLRDRSSSSTSVAEIMSHAVVTVSPADSVEHCMQLMTERRIRHLPVVEGGQHEQFLARPADQSEQDALRHHRLYSDHTQAGRPVVVERQTDQAGQQADQQAADRERENHTAA